MIVIGNAGAGPHGRLSLPQGPLHVPLCPMTRRFPFFLPASREYEPSSTVVNKTAASGPWSDRPVHNLGQLIG